MIQMEIEMCRIDNRPIDKSPAYKLLTLCLPGIAKSLTYTIVVPKDDDG
jgi:hypothetical protein